AVVLRHTPSVPAPNSPTAPQKVPATTGRATVRLAPNPLHNAFWPPPVAPVGAPNCPADDAHKPSPPHPQSARTGRDCRGRWFALGRNPPRARPNAPERQEQWPFRAGCPSPRPRPSPVGQVFHFR